MVNSLSENDMNFTGYGALKDAFPLEHTIVIAVKLTRGTYIDYTWDWGDGTVEELYNIEYASHQYTDVGKYYGTW